MSAALLVGLGIPMAIAVVLGGGGAVARARLRARYPAPGRLVDIGGHRLHLDCEGSAGPTVIFEGGLGAEAPLSWTLVRPAVADFARACVYDRADARLQRLGSRADAAGAAGVRSCCECRQRR